MHIKKTLLIGGAAVGVGLAGITGLGVASAASSTPEDSIIDRLTTRFHLNRNDVAAVFKEEKTARQAEHQQKVEDRLNQAVTDGKITEAQKAKILAKLDELQHDREAWRSKTPEERHQAMQDLRQTLQQWAKDNNIPMEYLHVGFAMHHGPDGPGMGMRFTEKD